MRILLTNDDGLESPALLPTIQMLETIGDVDVVVPRYEQSWTSKSNIRRAKTIVKETHEVDGYHITTLDARPADCANYGIFNLDETPDLVVSGANVGHNVGISAFFSSGTIGAALEGIFVGIPSVAISIPYQSGARLVSEPFEEAIQGAEDLLETFYHQPPENTGLMVVNLPYGKSQKSLIATSLGRYPYGRLFIDEKNCIRPSRYQELSYPKDIEKGTDVWARKENLGSVVMMDFDARLHNPAKVSSWLDLHQLNSLG